MGLLSRLIGGKTNGVSSALHTLGFKRTSTANGIGYDAGLVGRLRQDHRELLRIFAAIKRAAGEGDFDRLPDLLISFKQTFQAHMMLENVKFYIYLQLYCELDAETLSLVCEARKEMDGIGQSVAKFVNAHLACVPTPATLEGFKAELSQIGATLLWRVQLEESRLYALYQPRL